MSLGSLNIDLNANIIKFQAAMEKAAYVANQNMEKVSKAVGVTAAAAKNLEGALGKVGVALSTLGVVSGVAGLITVAKTSLEGAIELKHMSDQTGASVEALSALKAVSKLVGMDMKDAAAGVSKLSVAMSAAQGGSTKQQRAFERLGVSYVDAAGKLRPVGDVALDVGKKFADMENGAGKTGLAVDLMSKKGAAMIPMLQQLAERGNVTGKVTAELAEKAEHLEITWLKMVGKMNSWKFTVLESVIPMLERIIPLLPAMTTGIVAFFGVTKLLPMAIAGATRAITMLGVATSATGLIGLGVFSALRTAVNALTAAIAANPIGAIAVAILAAASAVYVFQDSLVTLGGTTASLGNWIGGTWDLIKEGAVTAWGATKDFFSKVKEGWQKYSSDATTAAGKGATATTSVWEQAKKAAIENLNSVLNSFKDYINFSIGGFVGMGRAFAVIYDEISNGWRDALKSMADLAVSFGKGVAATFSGDFSFSAFQDGLGKFGAKSSEVAAKVKAEFKAAMSFDYVGEAAGALGQIGAKIRENALARQRADDAERKKKKLAEAMQNSVAGDASKDPFVQAMQEMQRQAVGIQYVIDNFERLGGKVRESKVAMAEFDVTLGKFSDSQRKAAQLPVLTSTQKQAYKDQAKLLEDLELKEKRLIELKKFDDSIKKLQAETAGLRESAVQREINAKMADLEAQGIKKGTDEYIKRQNVLAAAVQDKHKVQFGLDMTEYIEQQKRSIDNDNFMISLLGRSSLEVAKLTEAHRIDAEVQEMIRKAQRDGLVLSQAEISNEYARADAIKRTRLAQIDLAAAIQRTPQFGASEAIRKYQEAANDAGTQIENTMTNALKGTEDAFVQFATTGKLSFKSLVDSITADIARMGIKDFISQGLGFVKGGGLGDSLASMLNRPKTGEVGTSAGGMASAASDAMSSTATTTAMTALSTSATAGSAALTTLSASTAASSAALTTMAASTTAFDVASTALSASLAALSTAAMAASTSLASVSASGSANTAGGIMSIFGSYANGGDPIVGRASIVGEDGPEIFVPKTAGTIIPNDVMKGGSGNSQPPQQNVYNINNYNSFAPGTDAGTIDQAAVKMGMQIQRSTRRSA